MTRKLKLFLVLVLTTFAAHGQFKFIPQYGHQYPITVMEARTSRYNLTGKDLLITGDSGGCIKLWNVRTKSPIQSIQPILHPVKHIEIGTYTEDNQMVVLYENYDSALLYNIRNDSYSVIYVGKGCIRAFPFAYNLEKRDVGLVYTNGRKNYSTGEFETIFENDDRSNLIYDRDALLFYEVVAYKNKVSVYFLNSLKFEMTLEEAVQDLEIGPKGEYIAGLTNSKIFLINTRNQTKVVVSMPDTAVRLLSFSSNDSMLLISNQLINLNTLKSKPFDIEKTDAGVLIYSEPEEQHIAVYAEKKNLEQRIVEIYGEGYTKKAWVDERRSIDGVALAVKRNELAVVGDGSQIYILDLNRGCLRKNFRCKGDWYPSAVAYNHAETELLVAVSGRIYRYDVNSLQLIDSVIFQRARHQWPKVHKLFYTKDDSEIVASLFLEDEYPDGLQSTGWVWQAKDFTLIDSTPLSKRWYHDFAELDNNRILGIDGNGMVELGMPNLNKVLVDCKNSASSFDEKTGLLWTLHPQHGLWARNTEMKVIQKVESFRAFRCINLVSQDGFVYGLSKALDNSYELWCFGSDENRVVWRKTLDEPASYLIRNTLTNHLIVTFVSGKTVWFDAKDGSELMTLYLWNKSDEYLFSSEDGYYKSSKLVGSRISLRQDGVNYPLRNAEMEMHRPDKILPLLNSKDKALVMLYEESYEKRVLREGNTSSTFKEAVDYKTPEVVLRAADAFETDGLDSMRFFLMINPIMQKLTRVHIWLNGNPMFGRYGKLIPQDLGMQGKELIVETPRIPGDNYFEAAVENEDGGLSKRVPFNFTSTNYYNPTLFLISLGVSNYLDSFWNLRYAEKDAMDVHKLLSQGIINEEYFWGSKSITNDYLSVESKLLINEKLSPQSFDSLNEWLSQARPNDRLIIYYAGHGLLDGTSYYLTTHYTNFDHPENGSIAYDSLESLLYRAPMIHKLVLLDACHSGELDPSFNADTLKGDEIVDLQVYANPTRGAKSVTKQKSTEQSFLMMKELFGDVSNRTGATIFSSASGTGYAMESEAWSNGIFTYSLLNGLISRDADLNKDKEILIDEMIKYVSEEVEKATNGSQIPDCRLMNTQQNWRVN